VFFFFQAEDGIRDRDVTGVQTCALPILSDFISAHDSVTLTTEQHPAKDDVMARSKIVVIGVFKRK